MHNRIDSLLVSYKVHVSRADFDLYALRKCLRLAADKLKGALGVPSRSMELNVSPKCIFVEVAQDPTEGKPCHPDEGDSQCDTISRHAGRSSRVRYPVSALCCRAQFDSSVLPSLPDNRTGRKRGRGVTVLLLGPRQSFRCGLICRPVCVSSAHFIIFCQATSSAWLI